MSTHTHVCGRGYWYWGDAPLQIYYIINDALKAKVFSAE